MAENKHNIPGKDESLMNKIRRFNTTIEEKIDPNLTFFQKLGIFLDFVREHRKYGVLLLDYTQYEFYWKRRNERRKYVTYRRLSEIMNTCNNPEHRYLFDQKPEFDKTFKKYLHRDFLDLREGNWEDFQKFVEGKDCFFSKDPNGMFGKGVEKHILNEVEDLKALYDDLKSRQVLCEEGLTQCKEMESFNESSINTIRVVSIVDANGVPQLLGGIIRFGRKGRVADNFHNHGIVAYLDAENGIAGSEGVDRDNVRYNIHPDSGQQIIGFKIPCWDKIVETVKEAALVVPDMRYMGWDIAITKDYEIALVEGNPGSDPDAEQISTRRGRWAVYEPLLKEIRALNAKK